jgi:hypothetical protein
MVILRGFQPFYHSFFILLLGVACTNNEPVITELGSGLPYPNFEGGLNKNFEIGLTSQAFTVQGSCDHRISELSLSVEGAEFKPLSSLTSLADVES